MSQEKETVTKIQETAQTEAHPKESMAFQAEVKQLLQLMIHSLYSNKEIVLRELISNASDAADKLRFEAVSNGGLYDGDSELKIRIAFDKEARTVTINDNGIGMSRDEVIANIGTIAKSGTKEFFNALSGKQGGCYLNHGFFCGINVKSVGPGQRRPVQ